MTPKKACQEDASTLPVSIGISSRFADLLRFSNSNLRRATTKKAERVSE